MLANGDQLVAALYFSTRLYGTYIAPILEGRALVLLKVHMAVSSSSSVPTIREDRFEHLEKADEPIKVALGSLAFDRLEQELNASYPKYVTKGQFTSVSPVDTNTPLFICTIFEKSNAVSLEQLLKAELGSSVTRGKDTS